MKVLLGKCRTDTTNEENKNITSETNAEQSQMKNLLQKTKITEEDIILTRQEVLQPDIMYEDISLRDTRIKHYRMTNGTMNAVIFNDPVHYYDEESHCFRSIDNRFKEVGESDEEFLNGYETRYNDFKVSLAGNTRGNFLMRVSKGEHAIRWAACDNIAVAQRAVENSGVRYSVKNTAVRAVIQHGDMSENQNRLHVNADGMMLYPDMFTNADLQYIVTGDKVKENIIVKQKDNAYAYAFKIKTQNLEVAVSADNKNIEFFVTRIVDDGTESKEVIFSTPTPIMYDANGNESEDVYYELEQIKLNEYLFTVIASADWINAENIALPVTIDPMIIVHTGYSSLKSKGIGNLSTTNYTEYTGVNYRTVGKMSNGQVWRSVFKYTMPTLDSYATVLSARLQLKRQGYSGSSMNGIQVLRVGSSKAIESYSWSDSYSVTGNILDYMECEPDDSRHYYIDLTEYVEKVRRGEWTNNGILLKAINEDSLAKGNYVRFYSEQETTVENRPMLVINYKTDKGYEEGQSYQENTCYRAGSSAVNLRTGMLNFKHIDVELSGERMPLNIKHFYNGNQAGSDYTTNSGYALGTGLRVGRGWRLNIQQMLIAAPLSNDNRTEKYIYIDADGTEHYLVLEGDNDDGKTYYIDEENLGFRMEAGTLIIKIDNGGEMHFNTSGFLTKLKNNFNSEINIYYDSNNRIISVKDGVGRYAYFYYENCCYLSRIVTPNNKTIRYSYDSSYRLLSITYPDGEQTQFSYENNKLKTVTDQSGYRLTYTYSGNKVTKVAESSIYTEIRGNGVNAGIQNGGYVNLHYISKNTTVVESDKGVKTAYTFDDYGKTVSMFEDLSSVDNSSRVYATGDVTYVGGSTERSINAVVPSNLTEFESGVYSNGVGINYLKDGALASVNALESGWKSYQNGALNTGIGGYQSGLSADAGETAYGLFGAKGALRYLKQTVPVENLETGKVYVLSGWSKADSVSIQNTYSVTGATPDRRFELRAEVKYPNGIIKKYSVPFDTHNTDWQFAATAFKLETQAQEVSIYAEYSDNANIAIFDRISLTTGAASVSETKIIDKANINAVYTFDDVVGARYTYYYNYGCCYSCGTRSAAYKVTSGDMSRMVEDYANGYIGALRMNNGRYIVSGARNIQFEMSDGTLLPIGRVKLERLTESNNGELEFSDERDSTNGNKVITQKIVSGSAQFITERTYSSKGLLLKEKDYRGKVIEYFYNDYGSRKKTMYYTVSQGSNSSNRIIAETAYTSNGNYVSSETDTRNYDGDHTLLKTSYSVDETSGLTNNITMQNGQVINYGYDNAGEKLNTVSAALNGVTYSNSFGYNKDFLTSILHNGFSYDFEYDGLGRIKNNKIAGTSVYSKTYEDTANEDKEIYTYANGTTVTEVLDKYGRIVKEYYGNETTARIENIYSDVPDINAPIVSGSSKIYKTIDRYAGKVYNTEYDEYGEVAKTEQTDGSGNAELSTEIIRDQKRRVTGKTYTVGGETASYEYGYDKDGAGNIYPDDRIKSVKLIGKHVSEDTLDGLGRLQSHRVTANGGLNYTETYTYQSGLSCTVCGSQADRTTEYVSGVTYTVNGNTQTESYTYDKNGHIRKKTTSAGSITYSYDSLNRLTVEDNGVTGVKTTWTYDVGGNIKQKRRTSGTTELSKTEYNYPTSGWKDQLTSVTENGITRLFAYDGCGNPTHYKSGEQNMWWTRGRMLGRYNAGGADVSYVYDLNGIRTVKTVLKNGVTTEYKYYTDDGVLLREDRVCGGSTQSLIYRFGTDGVTGFRYGTMEYYYRRNLQGDVVAIYDAAGNLKGEYRYGAYGECEIVTDIGGIASLNPLRYRGYYYDSETGLYYLKSRYYDPELGRFINADDIDAAEAMKTEPGGLNLYSYCLNDPVNSSDPDGDLPWWQKILIGVAVIAAVAVVAVATGGTGLVGAIAVGAVKGAVAGAISGAVMGGAIGGVTAAVKGEDVMQGMLNGAADGFMNGAITGAITGGIQGAASFAKASKMMGSLDDAAHFSKGVKTSKGCPKDCFVAGTLIKTEEGYKAIEEIEVGDKVWSWDEETGEQALKTVVQLFRNEKDVLVHIDVAGEHIQTTPGHPFYVAGKGWVKAGELKAGNELILYDGRVVEIEKVRVEKCKPVTTYNFEVEDSHTYYVTQSDVLCHNSCRGKNNLKPDSNAVGAHSTFRMDSTGKVTHYAEWTPNAKNPNGFGLVKRFDGIGGAHTNSVTGIEIATPHIHGKTVLGGVRTPYHWELPKGY